MVTTFSIYEHRYSTDYLMDPDTGRPGWKAVPITESNRSRETSYHFIQDNHGNIYNGDSRIVIRIKAVEIHFVVPLIFVVHLIFRLGASLVNSGSIALELLRGRITKEGALADLKKSAWKIVRVFVCAGLMYKALSFTLYDPYLGRIDFAKLERELNDDEDAYEREKNYFIRCFQPIVKIDSEKRDLRLNKYCTLFAVGQNFFSSLGRDRLYTQSRLV